MDGIFNPILSINDDYVGYEDQYEKKYNFDIDLI